VSKHIIKTNKLVSPEIRSEGWKKSKNYYLAYESTNCVF